ncbi:DUF4383 domain-containing protein [Actinomycetospora soli]|uniref:DUF4383 domain-containing protein n=1 Tax=Actinomycetospora soli TaxID=2893887 RepID=UPI001E564D83|nr:DUF4383 domain-containing protein [Actinomycetospora soli]MCD2186957.1 DUF1129 domain-containing protein [Actinomycetospora soli]
MSEGRTDYDPASQSDDPGRSSVHDEAGRSSSGPYVPSGRDEQGHPVPSVPHEGFLGRLATSLLLGQSVVLAVLAVWAFVAMGVSGAPARVLNLTVSPAHGVVLAATAVLGAASTVTRRWVRRWCVLQVLGYLVLYLVGLTAGGGPEQPGWIALNTPDHFLHLALALLGFVMMMLFSARIVEPPPGSEPYPNNRTDDPDAEAEEPGQN